MFICNFWKTMEVCYISIMRTCCIGVLTTDEKQVSHLGWDNINLCEFLN